MAQNQSQDDDHNCQGTGYRHYARPAQGGPAKTSYEQGKLDGAVFWVVAGVAGESCLGGRAQRGAD